MARRRQPTRCGERCSPEGCADSAWCAMPDHRREHEGGTEQHPPVGMSSQPAWVEDRPLAQVCDPAPATPGAILIHARRAASSPPAVATAPGVGASTRQKSSASPTRVGRDRGGHGADRPADGAIHQSLAGATSSWRCTTRAPADAPTTSHTRVMSASTVCSRMSVQAPAGPGGIPRAGVAGAPATDALDHRVATSASPRA